MEDVIFWGINEAQLTILGASLLFIVSILYVSFSVIIPVLGIAFLNPESRRSIARQTLIFSFAYAFIGACVAPFLLLTEDIISIYATIALVFGFLLLIRFVFEPKLKRYFETTYPGKPYPKNLKIMSFLMMETRAEGKSEEEKQKYFRRNTKRLIIGFLAFMIIVIGVDAYDIYTHKDKDPFDLTSIMAAIAVFPLAAIHPLFVKRAWLKFYHYALTAMILSVIVYAIYFGILFVLDDSFIPNINMLQRIILNDYFIGLLFQSVLYGFLFWLIIVKSNIQYAQKK